jgi:hypothetical protein
LKSNLTLATDVPSVVAGCSAKRLVAETFSAIKTIAKSRSMCPPRSGCENADHSGSVRGFAIGGSSFARVLLREHHMPVERISAADLKRRMDAHEPLAILDSRAPDAWKNSDVQIPGSIRVPPDQVEQHLDEIPRDRVVVAYCT